MIYVDSCVPMYLVGADHAHKRRTIELVTSLTSANETFVTSAETFQEIIHRYHALKDLKNMDIAYSALEEMVSKVSEVTKSDTDEARNLIARAKGLSSRDCLHIAIMKRLQCKKVWTYDSDFDQAPELIRIF